MIIRETNDAFIMIKQHDHAFISGHVAQHFKRNLLKSSTAMEDVIYASYEHDRSWIGLDSTPIWNDEINTPYSFSDFPHIPKLAFYKLGLDEIETVNPYASLLCSLHYCSFFSQPKEKVEVDFLNEERKRQENIKGNIKNLDHELLLEHFRLVQFCDDVSLYICIQEPGTPKEQEHPWFINGFGNSEIFHNGNHPIRANWLDENKITFTSFPFETNFYVTLKYKSVLKSAIQVMGIAKAYENSILEERQILLTNNQD